MRSILAMISFIRRRTAAVFAFVFLSLSILLYKVGDKVPIFGGFLQIVSDEMASPSDAAKAANVYGFKVKDLDGNEVDMEKYR